LEALALDFDGVISDSASESFLVALRTMERCDPRRFWSSARDELRGAELGTLREHRLYRDFLKLMPLGNRAEDFGVALRAIETGEVEMDQPKFDRFRDSLGADFASKFHGFFYEERLALRNADPAGWSALVGPFAEFVKILQRRAADRILAVATAKDRVSVDLLLRAYGIENLFPSELIVDKEAGRSKRAHLRLLRERLNVGFDRITFVDDKLNHLEDVSGLGVRCVLAAWGYNGDRERGLARERGFVVCELDNVEDRLFGAIERE